jgi:hypothetical protein
VRIGTWNLAGRWTPAHAALLEAAECDVWLLTEVDERVDLDGYLRHTTADVMSLRRRWAGVFSRTEMVPLPDPHPATAVVTVRGVTFWSSILPWRGCRSRPPWTGERHADKTAKSVAALMATIPSGRLVWGATGTTPYRVGSLLEAWKEGDTFLPPWTASD